MSTDTISSEALSRFRSLYAAKRRIKSTEVDINSKTYRAFVESRVAREEDLPVTSFQKYEAQSNDNLTRLAPDWKKRRTYGHIRIKTFIRIYLSKWFYSGLNWQEKEFFCELIKHHPFNYLAELFTNEVLNRIGFTFIIEETFIDEKRSYDSQGFALAPWNDLLPLIFSETELKAIWTLRSFQSIRDFLFVPFNPTEHEGKKYVRKQRIRGYRDGKSSPRDPRLTALARNVDVAFYSKEFEEKQRLLDEEIRALIST